MSTLMPLQIKNKASSEPNQKQMESNKDRAVKTR